MTLESSDWSSKRSRAAKSDLSGGARRQWECLHSEVHSLVDKHGEPYLMKSCQQGRKGSRSKPKVTSRTTGNKLQVHLSNLSSSQDQGCMCTMVCMQQLFPRTATSLFEHSHFASAGTCNLVPTHKALLPHRRATSGSHRRYWRARKIFGRCRYYFLGP